MASAKNLRVQAVGRRLTLEGGAAGIVARKPSIAQRSISRNVRN